MPQSPRPPPAPKCCTRGLETITVGSESPPTSKKEVAFHMGIRAGFLEVVEEEERRESIPTGVPGCEKDFQAETNKGAEAGKCHIQTRDS